MRQKICKICPESFRFGLVHECSAEQWINWKFDALQRNTIFINLNLKTLKTVKYSNEIVVLDTFLIVRRI